MPSGHGERYDFFLSRRGSVAAIAQEVTDVLKGSGYEVVVQDYDIQIGESWVLAIHDCIKSSRDLIILFTSDYEKSQYTREEFAAFWKKQADEPDKHRIIVLRCEDVQPEGLLSHNVFQDLVGVSDAEERKRRIIAAAERQSQAAPPPPRPFIGVPPRIASFTGRADELDRLDAILMQDKPAAVTRASVGRAAVQGMGGVGKTSLAIEYAHRFRGLYAGVCWCPAETPTGLLAALASLGVTLGAATAEEADVEKAAKAALRRLAEQRATWLLVYDNVSAPDNLAGLLPSAGACVLITSRFSDWGEIADEVALHVLPLEEAVVLLQGRTARSDPAGARMLAEALGCLPLALDHAAAYCKRSQMRFADYAEKASSIIRTVPRGAGYPRSVAATFDLAITEAVGQCAGTETLMAYLAQCAPERIPMTLVEGAVENEEERLEALAALAEVSLLKHDPFEDGTSAVTVHRLVQVVARTRSDARGLVQGAAEHLVARLKALYPEDGHGNPQSWSLCAQLTPHMSRIRKEDFESTSNLAAWADILDRAASYFHGRGAYKEAAPLRRGALAIREKTLGPDHPEIAKSLNNVALLLFDQGDYAEAQPLYERALAIREKSLGSDHRATAESLNNLGNLLNAKGEYTGSRRFHERALASYERVFGPEHPETAISLHNLAQSFQAQGDLAGARPLFERALAIREKALGAEHPSTAISLNGLGRLLQTEGDFGKARPLFERALAICEKALGPEHPSTASSLTNFATSLHAQGDLAGARPLFERALAIREKALGPEHPHTATSLSNLACLLRDTGLAAEAEPLFRRAIVLGEMALGPGHPNVATHLSNLAVLLRNSGRGGEAEPLFYRAIAIGETRLGPGHPLTQRYRSHFARLLVGTERPSEALAFGQAALAIHQAASGSSHPWTKDSARVTADALDALGRPEEAKALREKYGLTEPEQPQPS